MELQITTTLGLYNACGLLCMALIGVTQVMMGRIESGQRWIIMALAFMSVPLMTALGAKVSPMMEDLAILIPFIFMFGAMRSTPQYAQADSNDT